MQKPIARSKIGLFDLLILGILAALIGANVSFVKQCSAAYCPNYAIDLSFIELPFYILCSALRGLLAFLLSFAFTLIVGYQAAKSALAEKILIPLLDIFQSIPVLGFLPGLVLGLVALFPKTNAGLELACILMIFTGQVWNMTFSFYSSLKSIPPDLQEATKMMGMNVWQKFKRLEFPYSAMNLAWNCVLSMSGGWFFLCVCEAFTLAGQPYRLPGIGAYMATAIEQNNLQSILAAMGAMAFLIIAMDLLLWKPLLAWAYRFRIEEVPGQHLDNIPWLQLLQIRQSWLFSRLLSIFKKARHLLRHRINAKLSRGPSIHQRKSYQRLKKLFLLTGRWSFYSLIVSLSLWGLLHLTALLQLLLQVTGSDWKKLLIALMATFIKIIGALTLSSLWTIPVGIWIGTSPKIIPRAQAIIQLFSSFPAPMLYPLALAFFFSLGLSFSISSMLLMMLGIQWYLLYNVIAGTLRIPLELQFSCRSMQLSRYQLWKKLYLPSIFPSLITGWMTAAGGAWNASIVTEYFSYQGKTLMTLGVGSIINLAASSANFPLLAASLCLIVFVVVLLNRTLWAKLFHLAQNRYRMDL